MSGRNTLDKIYAIFDDIDPDEYGCHVYPGIPTKGGYCKVWFDGKRHFVHRVALERKLGRPIAPGYFALHNCDYPSCVNPEHLYEGTHYDNMNDKMKRNPDAFNQIRQLVHVRWGT
jgi:hypothetical protein